MVMSARSIRKIILSLLLLFIVSGGFAEETLDEIVVTADYRERKDIDIPSSISILNKEFIEKSSTQHFQELILSIPNLSWSGDGNRPRYFQIRGIGELEQYEGAPNPSIGFLIDDIDFSGIGSVATLFDIEQIEILRGSQGSRYGANALAGLIYMKSSEAASDFSGKFQMRVGEDNEIAGGFALGGPIVISNNMKYRLSLHKHQSNGFRKNSFLNRDNTNQREETTFRSKLSWDDVENWQFNLTIMFVDIDDGYDAFSINNSLNMLSDKPGMDSQKSKGSSLKALYNGSDLYAFESITSTAYSEMVFSYDADWGNENSWFPYTYNYFSGNKRKRQTLSQEIRFISKQKTRSFSDSEKWLFGMHILKLNDDLMTNSIGVYNDPIYVYEDSLDTTFNSKYESLNGSLFSQMHFGINENTLLTLGLRLENRSVDYLDSLKLNMKPRETMFGGEISLSNNYSEKIHGYLSLTQGFKAGGFNLGVIPSGKREFDKEILWNAEVGIKSTLYDGKLRLNSALFYSKRRDQQVRTSMQLIANDPASFVFFTDNAAIGKASGFEADLRWIKNEKFQMYVNLGLLKARFDEYIGVDISLNNRDVAHAPRYSINGGWEYRYPSGLFIMMSASARDEFYFDISHNEKSKSFRLFNARAGYESENWSLQLWANNLTNEKYAVRGFYFGNEPPDFPNKLYTRQGEPRQIGLTYEMRF